MVASKATFIRPAMAAHNQIGPHYLKWHRITSRNMLIRHLQIAKPNGPFCGAERPQCGASGQPFPT